MLRNLSILSIVAVFLLSSQLSIGQDTLKVMSYNLLNYPDGRDDCGANLTLTARWDTLRKILQFQKPDILMVCELQNEEGADSILSASLNVGGINYYARANFVYNQSGYTGLNNLFFYNTQKVTLHSQSEILTDLRDIGEYVVYVNDPNLATYNDTSFIRFYVGHLKAGNFNAPDEANRRASECTDLRTYIDGISSTGNFIFGGDFNFYTSSEPGYQILTTGGVNKLNDPINRPGNWNNNSSFADIHTQSTRSSQYIECGTPGGMDDRFDFILISDSVVNGGDNVQYINGTYGAFGNDANHFNQSLNSPTNSSLPDSVINALYYMSDHLPVILDLEITYPNVMVLSTAKTEITCNSDCDATATASIAGGSAPYTYLWDDPSVQTTLVATGLCAGTFRFTFTDSTGTSLVDSVVIVEPPVFSAAFSDSSIISCSGDSSGYATVSATGGIPAYTFLWDDPAAQTTATATGLTAGTYTVVVTDDRTCTDPASITIVQVASTPLSVNITDSTDIICNGFATGGATVSTSGGTTPYTFLWNDASAQTDSIATGLLAGTYAVAVTDSAGCPGADTVTIAQPAALNLVIIDSNTASCGSTNAFAAVTVSGGYAPYTYLWDDPSTQTLDTATALAAGIYVVIVTDSTGCIDSAQANLVDFSGPTIAITDSTNVACFGSGSGSATVTPSGGAPPYTYSWSPSGSTDSTANFLTAGVHTVTVIDNAPCTSVISVTITEPSVFTATLTDSLDILCFGDSTGTATVTPVGGVPPYTYNWSNGDTDSIADSLAPGSYTVTVADANVCNANGGAAMSNCFEIRSILVDACNPSGPESDNEMVRFEVGASDLSTAGLTVDWPNNNWDGLCQNAATSDIIDSINANITAGGIVVEPTGGVLPAGAHVMLITSDAMDWDSHDWSALDYTLYLIFQCDGNFSGHFKNADCACGSCALDRTLILDFGGGCADTVAYIPCDLDTVSGGSNGDEVEYDNEGNPTYQNIGCLPPVVLAIPPLSVTISQPASAVAASISSSTNILCFGDSIGTADASGSSGTPPYTYLWNDPSSQTDSNATALKAGTFTSYVTDNNGCIDSSTVTITEPASALVATMDDSLDIVCKGFATGSAEGSAAGGTSPYTYSWDDPSSQTTVIASSLLAGSYSFLVTDINGCQDSTTVTLGEPSLFTINTTDLVDAHCGQSDGTATVSSAGGTLPHTYQWDDPSSQTDTLATGLSAGTYKVVFTDAVGCTDSLILAINNIGGPGVNSTNTTTVVCNGDSTGTASVQAGGGTPPLTYLWDDVNTQTDSLATGLPAGVYNVTATDNFGCLTTSSASVSELSTLSLGTSSTSANCGLSDGTATVNASGGALSFSYSWNTSPVQTDSVATGLVGGTYTIVVTDTNGCQDSTTVVVAGLTNPTIDITDSVDVACNGDSTGSITASVSGGATPYTYLWNDASAQTDSVANNLPIGSYKIVVTTSNGCQDSASVTIGEPTVLSASITDSAACNCNADSTGYATVTPSGGLGAYTYLWNDVSAQTDSVANGLPAASYGVTITDNNGCLITVGTTIMEPTALSLSTSSTPASCGLPDGTATVNASGATGPYTYSWNTAPLQTDTTATGLLFGTYTITVIDSLGCVDSTTSGISNTGGPTVTITDSVNVLCNGDSTGSATVTPSGGTAPYVYLWDDVNTQTDSMAVGLPVGTYNVSVADSGGCGSVATVTITESLAFGFTMSSVSILCFGDSTGSATVSTSGATPPYTYLWDDFNSQTDSTAVGLPTGTYNVTVTDLNGCSDTDSIVVTEPLALALTPVGVNGTCGLANASASVSVSGGTGVYTYLWDDLGAQTTDTAIALTSGTFEVIVTDASGCMDSVSVLLITPGTPTIVLDSSNNLTCNGGNDGAIYSTSTGGSTPYTYSWSNSDTTDDITGLAVGTYILTVTDGNSCADTISATISEPSALTLTTSSLTPNCSGDSTGAVTTSASGGTGPYTYLWDDINAQTDSSATGLPAATYTVTVTDAGGCNDSIGVVITDPSPITVSFSTTLATCGDSSGSATVSVTGGTVPYSYIWNDPGSQTDSIATGLYAATFVVTVTDSLGCVSIDSVAVSQTTSFTLTTTSTDVLCNAGATGTAVVSPAGGSAPFAYLWNDLNLQTTANAIGLLAGNYVVLVTDSAGCTGNSTVTVNEPAAVGSAFSVTNESCSGSCDGSAIGTTSGGTGSASSWTYLWNNGDTTLNPSLLCTGIYTIVLLDSNGCSASDSVSIIQADTLVLATNVNDATCGNTNGSASVAVSGGSAPYSFAWDDPANQTTDTASGLGAGVYAVIVIDQNGCSDSTTVTIIELGAPSITVGTTTNASCPTITDGGADITVSGGSLPYTFQWSNTSTSEDLAGVGQGVYGVTVTDAGGCSASNSVTIGQDPGITATLTATPSVCIDSIGTATAVVTGGSPPYLYVWDDLNAQTTSTIIGLATGTYNVTIADLNACSTVESVTVTGTSGPVINNAIVSNVSCSDGMDGSATVYFTGGSLPYIAIWTDSSLALLSTGTNVLPFSTISDLSAGTYYVAVLDAQGCIALDSVVITADPSCFNVPSSFTPNGDLINDTWIIRGIDNYPGNTVEIFNRWGSLIYSSDGYADPWDGTYNGVDVASATYYFIIVLNETDDPITGSITIVR